MRYPKHKDAGFPCEDWEISEGFLCEEPLYSWDMENQGRIALRETSIKDGLQCDEFRRSVKDYSLRNCSKHTLCIKNPGLIFPREIRGGFPCEKREVKDGFHMYSPWGSIICIMYKLEKDFPVRNEKGRLSLWKIRKSSQDFPVKNYGVGYARYEKKISKQFFPVRNKKSRMHFTLKH